MNEAYEQMKSRAESLRTMIQLREPPFEGEVVSTFNAMDGALAVDDEATLWKTARMMKKAGATKRSDGDWNLAPVRRKGYVLKEWQTQGEGRTAGRETIYPFTKMEPGDAVSFPNENFKGRAYRAAMVYGHRTGKKFTGRLWTEADGRTGIAIERTDDNDQPEKEKDTTEVEAIKALIDWKAGAFVHDIITATDVVKTLQGVIPNVTPVKVGLLLRKTPGVKRVRAYDGKGQVMVWVIRNFSRYESVRGGKLWRLYKNERESLQNPV